MSRAKLPAQKAPTIMIMNPRNAISSLYLDNVTILHSCLCVPRMGGRIMRAFKVYLTVLDFFTTERSRLMISDLHASRECIFKSLFGPKVYVCIHGSLCVFVHGRVVQPRVAV